MNSILRGPCQQLLTLLTLKSATALYRENFIPVSDGIDSDVFANTISFQRQRALSKQGSRGKEPRCFPFIFGKLCNFAPTLHRIGCSPAIFFISDNNFATRAVDIVCVMFYKRGVSK